MALKVVSMEELRLEVLLEPERTGESIVAVCARRGISRASFYRYRRRFLEEGAEGLEPRTRRPRSSPARIAATLEAEICALRRRHPRWGARSIRAELRLAGLDPLAISTIHASTSPARSPTSTTARSSCAQCRPTAAARVSSTLLASGQTARRRGSVFNRQKGVTFQPALIALSRSDGRPFHRRS